MSGGSIPWKDLIGGYRISYDPRPALEAAAGASDWDELWENLYHQGDVDTASYAAIPEIAAIIMAGPGDDWNAYALTATIEEARQQGQNPPVPAWLNASYRAAWKAVLPHACHRLVETDDPLLVRSIIAVVAHAKGNARLGTIALWDDDELREALDR